MAREDTDRLAPADRVALLFDGTRRRTRALVTPEGVALRVDIAQRGERVGAFLLDVLFWSLATAAIFVALLIAGAGGMEGDVLTTIVLFLAFLLRNLYFIHFELAWRGRTPGKRICGLRVVDRAGGHLAAGAVVARNLTREVELFLPLEALASVAAANGVAVWAQLATFGWIVAIAAIPFLNRDHLRAGDLIAGTLVIAMPRRALAPELAEDTTDYVFTPAQLRAYGAFELQVLEELLRQGRSQDTRRLHAEVAAKISQRIGWPVPVPELDHERFLRAFYTAERAELEREQLYGRRRDDKDAARQRSTR